VTIGGRSCPLPERVTATDAVAPEADSAVGPAADATTRSEIRRQLIPSEKHVIAPPVSSET
jgi:hypothetical protein